MTEIILFGAGGHAAVIVDILQAQIQLGAAIKIKGFLDDSDKLEWMGYPVLGPISSAMAFHEENVSFIIAIGNNLVREMIEREFSALSFFTAIHPTAIVGSNVNIGAGTVVMPRVVINGNTQIGRHVILNSASVIEHDNMIDDYVHISPGAILCGTVKVGKKTHIGANATIIQGMSVGESCVIGAGSTVIRPISSQILAVGSPAKVIKKV